MANILIIDESWQLLCGHADISNYIMGAYRTYRKLNGSCITITQNIKDMYETDGGRAIVDNSANIWMLGQKAESIDALKRDQELSLGEGGFELLKTLKTVPNRYSEIFFYRVEPKSHHKVWPFR